MSYNESEILPFSSDVSSGGVLQINGHSIDDLVKEFGSPLYIYDEGTIRKMCSDFKESFQEFYQNSHIEYSCKAFANPFVNKIIDEEGLYMDVVTGGELAIAIASKFPSSKLNFHGNNKGKEELIQALNYEVEHITIDSFAEINLLNDISVQLGKFQKVMLRLSPSIDPHTHLLTSTGILDSKFGFSVETGDAELAIKQTLDKSNLILEGVHFHLGSPIFELEPFSEAIEYVLGFCYEMKKKYSFNLKRFSPGGGFAIGYQTDKKPPEISEYAKVISDSIKISCDKYNLEYPELVVEPGRSIIGRSGVAVYTVGGIKKVKDVRTYVSVDGGMGDNIRPALYQSEYSVISAEKVNEKRDNLVTIAGKFCESGDILAKDVFIPNPQIGDLLALPASGAYNLMMASNYNMQTKPAVILIKSSSESPVLISRRETYEDLLRLSTFE